MRSLLKKPVPARRDTLGPVQTWWRHRLWVMVGLAVFSLLPGLSPAAVEGEGDKRSPLSDPLLVGESSVQTLMPKGAKYMRGELIVKLVKGGNYAAVISLRERVGAKLKKTIRQLGLEVWILPVKDEAGLLMLIQEISADQNIEYAELNYLQKAIGIPNDTELGSMDNNLTQGAVPTIVDKKPEQVVFSVAPTVSKTFVGQTFYVRILVRAGKQPIDGASVYLNFDPTALQVESLIPDKRRLDMVLEKSFDNKLGYINFAAGKLMGKKPSGTFSLFTIQMKALAKMPQESSSLSFRFDMPRRTEATFGGQSVLDQAQGRTINLQVEVTHPK